MKKFLILFFSVIIILTTTGCNKEKEISPFYESKIVKIEGYDIPLLSKTTNQFGGDDYSFYFFTVNNFLNIPGWRVKQILPYTSDPRYYVVVLEKVIIYEN